MEAIELLRQNLKVGEPISNAYDKVSKLVKERNSDLHVHTNLGFGIGYQFKNENLMINATNNISVKPGMAFHARIAFTGVHSDPTRGSIAIGDTFLVQEDGEVMEMTKDI